MSETTLKKSVQVFGKKKTATAVAYVTEGIGFIKVNGVPLRLLEPEILRHKVYEPLWVVGTDYFNNLNIRIKVRGGGYTAQVYAIRQCISRALIAWYQKYEDEATKKELKSILSTYDKSLVVGDPRRCEPKKFGGRGARARFQKSYR
eukprot:TRINITY_DN258_c0_g1_i1.p1 TRINITY_DN258_c0_g1~~TRINITY_DN258_c0_g1_i1.p1  ORF type:complete len:147 (-),score=33.25 TRINITY_DN258_c0_g1_i1:96-536(-)